jgi:hypothetical protein
MAFFSWVERLEAEPKKRGCIGGGDLAFAFETGKIPQKISSCFPGFNSDRSGYILLRTEAD